MRSFSKRLGQFISQIFQPLLCSQRADFEFHFELLTNVVERPAGILEDVLDSAFDVFEVMNLFHCASFFSECSLRRLRRYSCRPVDRFDEKSRIALHVVQEHPLLPAFTVKTFPWPVQLQHKNFITSCLLILFSCSFGACSLKVLNFSALLSPVNMLLCQRISPAVSGSLLSEVLCTYPWKVRWNRSRTNLRPTIILSFSIL